jgi:eukaryotic-like serine/threonine-protein kinase
MTYCIECKTPTTPNDPFCGICGAPQRDIPRPSASGASRSSVPIGNAGGGNSKQLLSGTVLSNRYVILKRIGGGGMGSVYYAEDRNLASRSVAVKEMLDMFSDEYARKKGIEDFKRESELLARLEHPSIPTIYDYFFDPARERYYLVMKLINGKNLAEKLEDSGIINEQIVTQWAVQACDVLDYIHSLNPPIIYRDLKPANLMIDSQTNRLMLVDFGIARFVTTEQQKCVTAIGTMGYAPPELFSGNVDPRSDIYSLGATIFHLLTGKNPQDEPLLIFDFSQNPRPRQINPNITPTMEGLIERMIARKPESRFQSARMLGVKLEGHLEDLKRSSVPGAVTPIEKLNSSATISNGQTHCFNCGKGVSYGDPFCSWCGQKQS